MRCHRLTVAAAFLVLLIPNYAVSQETISSGRVYQNRLTRIESPKPLLADHPEFFEPIIEQAHFEAPPLVVDEGADLHVRAWRFSYNARGIIEIPNQLKASQTAVIMVHPWGIDEGQGWNTPEPNGVADFCTPEKNHLAARHTRQVVRPFINSLRGKAAFVMYSLPGEKDPIRHKLYRSFTHQPTEAQRREGARELHEKLTTFKYQGQPLPAQLTLSQDKPVMDYFRQFPGLDAGDKFNNAGFWKLPIPVTKDVDVHPRDVVIYDAQGYEPLKKFLQANGVRHVLLTGYATDMCFCRTTAGYENLSKDFNVFLVGDASLATFPSNTSPRFAVNAAISFAALNQLVTQVSWVKFEPPKVAAHWKAGGAKAVITPDKPVWLAGYGSKRPPDGKLHELWMKALALEDQKGRQAVLITSDFQGVPKGMSDQVFAQLEQKYGLKRHQVMLTFSHNHCGPRLGDDLVDYYPIETEQVKLVEQYTAQMVTKCVEMVGQSLNNLAPARLAAGAGKTTFAVNRRNNKEADVPKLLAEGVPLKGPVDHSVPVLTVTRPDGALSAVLFGYACHPTTLSFQTWCGDYPGFAQLEVERNHPGAMAMFVNTCGGDQNPLPRRSVELCQRYGHMLATSVEDVLKQPQKPISSELSTAFEYVDLPYLKVATREELNVAMRDRNAILARWAGRMREKLENGEKFAPAYPYPLHAWRLGKEVLMIGMGAETVVDYALRFKKEFKQDFGSGVWVCGYADDMIAYIPSRRVWEEGGYEGGSRLYEYGRPAFRWAGDIEDRIAEKVHKLVKQVSE